MVLLTSFPPPTEGVRHCQESTQAHVQGKNMGQGTLYIADSRVSWRGAEGQGFSLEYEAITLHAVSRDLSSFPHPCLYLMVDADLGVTEGNNQNGTSESSGEEEDEQAGKISEIRFIPTNPASLDPMFRAMSECQSLHPDQNDSISEDDEEGYFEDEEGAQHLTEQGQATLSRLEAMLDPGDDGIVRDEPQIGARANGDPNVAAPEEEMDTAQFEDAD